LKRTTWIIVPPCDRFGSEADMLPKEFGF